ncbi:Hydantoinase B/oxoprolinase-domain-containing protein [Xylariaceae sp. FL1272]|nr:Hydantoinase B/oxoprolinase-domain-containing protein [Xylariaceae sp. FL1272]
MFDVDGGVGFGYYETIAGGSGAGAAWEGTSGVRTHTNNTRITDPESLERRYPVLLKSCGLRAGCGGGMVRDVAFRVPMSASILSERLAALHRSALREDPKGDATKTHGSGQECGRGRGRKQSGDREKQFRQRRGVKEIDEVSPCFVGLGARPYHLRLPLYPGNVFN